MGDDSESANGNVVSWQTRRVPTIRAEVRTPTLTERLHLAALRVANRALRGLNRWLRQRTR